MNKRGINKKGIEIQILFWTIVGLFVLVIGIGGYMILKVKGIDAIEFLKQLFRLKG